MSRKKYDDIFKIKVVREYKAGDTYKLSQKYGVDAKCIRSWCRLYIQII